MGKLVDLVEQVLSERPRGRSSAWYADGGANDENYDFDAGGKFEKIVKLGAKNGVDEETVTRYWNEAKGNEKAIYARIKNKARQLKKKGK